MRQKKMASYIWQAWALSLALGLAILGTGIGLAHAERQLLHRQAETALASTTNEFACHAKPGGWCDLRDRGVPVVVSLPMRAIDQ